MELAGKAASDDPVVGLRAVAALHRLLERLMVIQVRNARAGGWSWEEIASALGISRQAVHKKYRGQIP
jgi:Homeodomain-like domain-containing protein